MSSSQSSFAGTSHVSQSTTAFSLPFSVGSSYPGPSQETASTTSTLVDPNSPEVFRQHTQLAMEQVARVNALARNALNSIQNAYHAGVSPTQTQGEHKALVFTPLATQGVTGTADLTALDHALHTLVDVLRQSGVGAYPIPDARDPGPPSEQQLIAKTTRTVQQLYEEFKRMQESSAVVANLLAASESVIVGRPKA